MYTKRGRRRKIESADLSEFGEALEEIFSSGDIIQKDLSVAGGLATSTISSMKVGDRMTRDNVRKILLGLIRIRYITLDNFDQVAIRLLELADEKPLNEDHKKDADVIAMLHNLHQIGVNQENEVNLPFGGKTVVITVPGFTFVMEYEGENSYRVEKVLVK